MIFHIGRLVLFCRFMEVDPKGWLLSLCNNRIQISRFGIAKYIEKNEGKRYAVQFFGRLWRMG